MSENELQDELREDALMVMTVRLSREQHDQLRAIADAEHRTIAGEIRRLVDSRILAYKQQLARP